MIDYIGNKLDGRYEILELIGVGGMANVYKARDLKADRIVAVKILREEFLDNEELVRRFKNESKAIGLLSHPNIVKVYDVNFSDAVQYIVMEFIDGVTLKDYIDRKKPLSWKDTVHFTVQILRALQHAHDRGIVHRDIKPQNIMLLSDGSIKVMDFGIARFSRSETRTITDKTIGSVHYISPEQAKGDITDAKADLYSVGIMMYEMLTGRLPFDSDSAVSIAIKQISDNAKRPREIVPEIPEALEEITLKAMAKDPNVRYQSASQMLRDIDDFKKNPSIVFAYKYFTAETNATQYIDKTAAPAKSGAAKANGKNAKNGRKPRKKGSLSIALLLGITAACVISTAVLLIFAFGLLDDQAMDTELPNFVGMNLSDIQSNQDYKFKFKIIEEYNSDGNYPIGTVYDQSPLPPKQIKETGTVTLYVSKGTEIVQIPEVVGMSSGEAKTMLRNLDLVVRQESVSDESYETNKVVQINPIVGTEVESGSTVTIYVNTLSMSSTATVPSLIGMTVYEATSTLSSYGLRKGTVTLQESDQEAGKVIGQSVDPEKIVASNTSIDLVVSAGKVEKEITVAGITLPNEVDGTNSFTVTARFGEETVYSAAMTGGSAINFKFKTTADGSLTIYIGTHAYCTFTVNYAAGTAVAGPTNDLSGTNNPPSITSPNPASVAVGSTGQLTANVAVTWSSSEPNIAQVDANGVVSGKAPGSVTITATAKNGKTATCTVNVTA